MTYNINRIAQSLSLLIRKYDNIRLLKNANVIWWIYGDTSFLPAHPADMGAKSAIHHWNKKSEDEWGISALKMCYGGANISANRTQWTGTFGEHICRELCILHGHITQTPRTYEHFRPDLETEADIWEVKTGTYFTSGTAHEKILGVAYKYADIPNLYGKSLKILCIGQADVYGQHMELFSTPTNTLRAQWLNCIRSNRIEYVSARAHIWQLIQSIDPLPLPPSPMDGSILSIQSQSSRDVSNELPDDKPACPIYTGDLEIVQLQSEK